MQTQNRMAKKEAHRSQILLRLENCKSPDGSRNYLTAMENCWYLPLNEKLRAIHTQVHQKTSQRMFTASLFIRAQGWKSTQMSFSSIMNK